MDVFFHGVFELLFFHIICAVLSEVIIHVFSTRGGMIFYGILNPFFRFFYLEVLVFLMLAVVVEVGGNL